MSGGQYWQELLPPEMKLSWQQRADHLNTRTIPGLLTMLPPDDNYKTMLMFALQVDLKNLCGIIHFSIKRPPRTEFDKVVKVGYEVIELQL